MHIHMDVQVPFPKEPRAVQVKMSNIIIDTCLVKEQNALIEAPMGSGKTLALLATSVGLLNCKSLKIRRIYYVSRTIQQLRQATSELKLLSQDLILAVQLASRNEYCVNSQLKGKEVGMDLLNQGCKQLGTCCQFNENMKHISSRSIVGRAYDIEDMVEFCVKKSKAPCPYYMSHKIAKTAKIVFTTMAMFFERDFALAELKDCIVLIDEAHTIEKIIENKSTFEFDLATTPREILHIITFFKEGKILPLDFYPGISRFVQLSPVLWVFIDLFCKALRLSILSLKHSILLKRIYHS